MKITSILNFLIFSLTISSIFSCSKQEDENPLVSNSNELKTTVKNTIIPLNLSDLSTSDIKISIDNSIPGTTLYSKDGNLHLIILPTLFYNEPLIPALHFIKKNKEWIFESSYSDGSMGMGRDSEVFDDKGTIVFADHGLEPSQGIWPFGNLMISKINGEKLTWSTITKDRSFYHSISTGDLNNDGLKDLIGLNMGTRGNWTDNLHPFIQKTDGTFQEDRKLISNSNWQGNYGAGAVLIANIMGDSRPEIIRADYVIMPAFPSPRYSFSIFSYNPQTGNYEFIKTPGVFGFALQDFGVTSMKTIDYDKDGDLDIVLAYENFNRVNGVEIWTNNRNGDFTYSNFKLEYSFDELQFREFEIVDVDEDGWPDIVLNPWTGKQFKTVNVGNGDVFLHNFIWKNNNGKFQKLIQEQKISLNQVPTYMKAFVVNNKLKFIGITGNSDRTITISEIDPVF